MKKQATLSFKLNRLVLPVIIVPFLLSGFLAFWVYYQDARYRFEHYINDRGKDIQDLSTAPAVEQYFISRQFALAEETDFYISKIEQLLSDYLERPHPSGLFFKKLTVVDPSGRPIAAKGSPQTLKLPGADALSDYLADIKAVPQGGVFQTHNADIMFQAVPIWVDLNSDNKISGNEFSGFIAAQSDNPFLTFLNAAIKTGAITLTILVATIICGLFLTKRFINKITHPLSGLARHVESITGGHFEFYDHDDTTVEIDHLTKSFNRMQAELKKSDIRIRQQLDLLKSLNVTSRRISSSLDMEEVLHILLSALNSTFDFKQLHFVLIHTNTEAWLYVPDIQGDRFVFDIRKMESEDEAYVRGFLKTSKSAALMERPFVGDILPPAFLKPENHEQLIGIPLRFLEEPIGAIWITIAPGNTPSEEMLDYLSSIAGQAAISLKNANLFREINKVKELLEQDIIERERETREKEKLQAQLMQAYKMEAIGTLAGGIAHDFNNILSSIIGFAELALDDVEKGSLVADNLQQVFIAAQRARDLVKQILTFARQTDEELKPVRVDIVAKETLKLLRSSIPSTIRIKQNIRSQSLVRANPTQLQQIFMNLCTNASHAMEENGGMLEIVMIDEVVDAEAARRFESMQPGAYLKIVVSDTGCGIPVQAIGSIFEPFYTTKAPGEGTGMGLSVVHGIVQKFEGHIFVRSELGKGTVFTIYLPVSKEKAEQRELEEEIPLKGSERILIVDDDGQVLEMGSQALARLGYAVTTQSSGIAALALFRNHPDDFDLVISDMTMPSMTGDDLAVAMMKIRPDIPVVLLTGYSKKITEETAAEIGIKAFAYKPIIKRDLAAMVRKVLDEVAARKDDAKLQKGAAN